MKTELELKKEICEYGKRLYTKNLLSSTDGSISLKLNEKEYLCTATGTNKGHLSFHSLCKVDENGKQSLNSEGKVSSAVHAHMLIHRLRPEMEAVIHAYPLNATTLANLGMPLMDTASLEAINCTGCIPYIEKALFETKEERQELESLVRHFDAILCGDIGVLTFGRTLENAYHKLESVELFASIIANGKTYTQHSTSREGSAIHKRAKYKFAQKHPQCICVRHRLGLASCHSCTTEKIEKPVVSVSSAESKILVETIKNKVIELLG